jgi:hypothetical protein
VVAGGNGVEAVHQVQGQGRTVGGGAVARAF